MSTDHQNPSATEDVNALADRARSLGLARKAPAPAGAAKPAVASPFTPAPVASPFGAAVETTRAAGQAPRTRSFTVSNPVMRHRADGLVRTIRNTNEETR